MAAFEESQNEQSNTVGRREFLERCGGLLLGIGGLAMGGVLSGCGGGDGGPDNSGGGGLPGVTLTVLSNGNDPLLLSAQRTDGQLVEYFGLRNTQGVPTAVNHIRISQGNSISRYDLDAQGRPVRFTGPDNTQLSLEYVGANQVAVTATSPSGSAQVNTSVNVATGSSTALIGRRPSAGSCCGTGSSSAVEAPTSTTSPSSTTVLTVPSSTGRNLTPRGGQAIRLSPGSSKLTSTPRAQTATSGVTVNVRRCGALSKDFASVQVVANDSAGRLKGVFPATRVSDGVYRASIPNGLAPIINRGPACENIAGVMGRVCDAVDIGGKFGIEFGVRVCQALGIALDVATVPSGEAVILVAGCRTFGTGLKLYCSTLGVSTVEGMDDLPEILCKSSFVNRDVQTDLQLRAQVVALPANVTGPAIAVPGNGPYPELNLSLGDRTFINSFVLTPTNPTAGRNYVGTARVTCVPAGATVTLSIVGTDGYDDSATQEIFNTSPESSFSLNVPGARSAVQDTVTLSIRIPNGQTITRTASLVFG